MRALGDGSCFFHALRLSGVTDMSVEELRQCVGCLQPQEADAVSAFGPL